MNLIRTLIGLLCLWSSHLSVAQRTDFPTIDFKAADSIAALYPNHSLTDFHNLSYKLTHDLKTDVEKFRSVFSWVCNNITNDYELFVTNQRNREKLKDKKLLDEWNSKIRAAMFRKLVNNHSTVCTGYAYLLRELLIHAGIESKIIDGYGRTIQANIGGEGIANHTWNAVLLNHKWYLTDPTWASGAIDMTSRKFIKNYNDVYFLPNPEIFIRNHFPLDTAWLLTTKEFSLSEFLQAPIIYSGLYKHSITQISPDKLQATAESKTVTVCLTGDASIERLTFRIGNASRNITPVIQEIRSGIYNVSYTFKRNGKYSLHGFIDDAALFTYSVTVN